MLLGLTVRDIDPLRNPGDIEQIKNRFGLTTAPSNEVLVAAGAFNWFGRLPGDVRIEGERTRVYVPLVSMLLLSLVLTILLNLFLRR